MLVAVNRVFLVPLVVIGNGMVKADDVDDMTPVNLDPEEAVVAAALLPVEALAALWLPVALCAAEFVPTP